MMVIALALPVRVELKVTRLPLNHSAPALPIAMERPLRSNIATSLPPSPMTAISESGTASSLASSDTAVPLLASGCVMSR